MHYGHDDVIKWKHFPCYWPFVRGIHWSPVNCPSQRVVTRSFDVFFDLRLNKRFSKQSRRRWFETPSRSLWRHYNAWNVSSQQHLEVVLCSHMHIFWKVTITKVLKFTEQWSSTQITRPNHIYIYIITSLSYQNDIATSFWRTVKSLI